MASPVTATSTGAPSAPAATPAVIIMTAKPGPVAAATITSDVLFHVQIAATPEEHASGLTGRPSLAADAGLLSVFPSSAVQSLSMKNNLIPLDLIFIGANRRIVGIVQKAPPRSKTARRVGVASQFVLQIRAGLTAQHGFKVGQAVVFVAVPGV